MREPTWIKQLGGLPKIAPPVSPHCPYCGGSGDVHSFDGEWRGVCTECPAYAELAQTQQEAENGLFCEESNDEQ